METKKDNNIIYPFKAGSGNLGESRKKSPRIESEKGKNSLTEKQSTILKFIENHSFEVGFPPTVREIAAYFNISAKAAHDHLKAISKKGYIRLLPGSARGIELVHKTLHDPVTSENIVMIPLLGSIAAGTPILAEENIDSHITLPASFVPPSGDMFALKVKGDSMEKAGIFEDDIAVLKHIKDVNIEVKSGDIVAAMIDGEVTLKTLIKKKGSVELNPENPAYKPIILTGKLNEQIIAKLIGIYRKYKT
jgi:repressor LexA